MQLLQKIQTLTDAPEGKKHALRAGAIIIMMTFSSFNLLEFNNHCSFTEVYSVTTSPGFPSQCQGCTDHAFGPMVLCSATHLDLSAVLERSRRLSAC